MLSIHSLSFSPLSFGARFIQSFPLEIQERGRPPRRISGQLYQVDPRDARKYRQTLSRWQRLNDLSLAHNPLDYLAGLKPEKKLYVLKGKIDRRERLLGYVMGSQGQNGEHWIDCIEKAPGISSPGYRIKNILTALLYGYIQDRHVAASRHGLTWLPLDYAIQAYNRLFQGILGRFPKLFSEKDVPIMSLTPDDLLAFQQQVETRFLQES